MYCINKVTMKLLLFSGMCFLLQLASFILYLMNALTNIGETIT